MAWRCKEHNIWHYNIDNYFIYFFFILFCTIRAIWMILYIYMGSINSEPVFKILWKFYINFFQWPYISWGNCWAIMTMQEVLLLFCTQRQTSLSNKLIFKVFTWLYSRARKEAVSYQKSCIIYDPFVYPIIKPLWYMYICIHISLVGWTSFFRKL